MAKQTTSSRTKARKSSTGKKAPSAKKRTPRTQKQSGRSTSDEGPAAAGDREVTIDRRRRRRRDGSRRTEDPTDAAGPSSAPTLERRKKVNRRRQIDPTTCERDYSDEEIAFMNALDEYKRKSGRMFPTCSEVLEVIRDLGYVKLPGGGASEGSGSNTLPIESLPAEELPA